MQRLDVHVELRMEAGVIARTCSELVTGERRHGHPLMLSKTKGVQVAFLCEGEAEKMWPFVFLKVKG